MANIIGAKSTGLIEQHRLVIDMEDTIHLLDPDSTPLLALTNLLGKAKGGKQTIHNPEFYWMEDDYLGTYTTVNGDHSANATQIKVADSSIFKPNDIVTSTDTAGCDYMLVTAVNRSTNVLTVTRRIAGETTAPAIDDGALLVRITDAFEEGANKGEMISTQTVQLSNYAQIIRTPFGVTGTLDATKLYGGADLGYQRKKAGIEHAMKIERAYLFGKKGKIAGNYPRRYMDGIINFIKTNVVDAGGNPLTETLFESFLEQVFQYGNSTKYLFAAPKIISYINTWARGKLQLLPKDKTYGINVSQYLSAHGELYIINAKKIFNITPWNSMAIVIDLDKIVPVTLRPTKLRTNIQNPDEDKEIDEYIGEYSIKVYNEKCHGVLMNVD